MPSKPPKRAKKLPNSRRSIGHAGLAARPIDARYKTMLRNVMSVPGNLAVARRHDGDVVVLAVSGVIDEITAPSLATHLDTAMTQQPRLLIVDLRAVEFMSSSGINLLVEMHRLTAPTTTTLRVAADGPATSRPMRLLGVERLIELYATADEALAAG